MKKNFIIALAACLAGEVQRYLTRGLYEEAKAIADAVVAPCIEDGFAEAVERIALR